MGGPWKKSLQGRQLTANIKEQVQEDKVENCVGRLQFNDFFRLVHFLVDARLKKYEHSHHTILLLLDGQDIVRRKLGMTTFVR